MSNIKTDVSDIQKNLAESQRLRIKYPDRIPIVVSKGKDCVLPNLSKNKFLVPSDLTVAQFMFVIRKRMCLPPEQALYLMMSDLLLEGGLQMTQVLEMASIKKDFDGFIHLIYLSETTFG